MKFHIYVFLYNKVLHLFYPASAFFSGHLFFNVNSCPLRTKWTLSCRRYFQMHFREWKVLYFDTNFTEVCSLGFNWQKNSVGLDNGLAPNRRQAIIWTNADPIHGLTFAALGGDELNHWGRATHICVGNLTTIGSDNGLSPGRCQSIIWTNAGMFLIGPLGTNYNEILIQICAFPLTKIHLKMSSGKWRPFCLGLNVLTHWGLVRYIGIDELGPHSFR